MRCREPIGYFFKEGITEPLNRFIILSYINALYHYQISYANIYTLLQLDRITTKFQHDVDGLVQEKCNSMFSGTWHIECNYEGVFAAPVVRGLFTAFISGNITLR